jgi:hypothetical protein
VQEAREVLGPTVEAVLADDLHGSLTTPVAVSLDPEAALIGRDHL